MKYPKSNNYDGDVFFNPDKQPVRGFIDLMKWQLGSDKAKWPEWRDNNLKPNLPIKLEENQAATTFINHATHLIQINGQNILTDPVFSERASPFSWLGPKRIHPPSIDIKNLPKIDAVLISHNHYDHMDAESISTLSQLFDPLFVVPLGNAKLIKEMGAKNVIELDWWESAPLPNSEIKIHLVPAQHWSARGLFDRNKSFWGGFIIKNNLLQIYFAGDTGYGKFFSEINSRFGKMNLSILPIGAYEPRWFMKEQHMNPDDAVQAHLDLNSELSLGTHFGTFQLTDEGVDEPVLALQKSLEKYKIELSKFKAPQLGETHIIKK